MQMTQRKRTRVISVGDVLIGGDNPIVVQSMTNTDTRDIDATIAQIIQLVDAGCGIVRVAVMDRTAAHALSSIIDASPVPIIADIHFDYTLALFSMDAGASGIRINPGNIGSIDRIAAVIDRAKDNNVAIRIGVNSGSLESDILEKFGSPTPEALVESALRSISMFEARGYTNIKLSLKSAHVMETIAAYRQISERVDYPLHVGVTEAGTVLRGSVKSAVGIGILLHEGIGDTIRVSLSGDPINEPIVAYTILAALGIEKRGVNVIACPTCGRTALDIAHVADEVEKRLQHITTPLTVAVMGCEVNGPGEAKEADIGICGGKKAGLLIKKGEIIRKVLPDKLVEVLVEEVTQMSDTIEKGDS